MSDKNKFNICWIGYCAPLNKVWGWFIHTDQNQNTHTYCFWCHMRKTISFTKFPFYNNKNFFENKRNVKIKNGYTEIKLNELLLIWPKFFTNLEENFFLNKLVEKI
jgi:hypothetical protein